MCAKLLKRFVGAFAKTTRVGIMNELRVEVRVEDTVYSVMEQTVAYAGFMDVARLWVADTEVVVSGVGVGFGCKVVVEREDVMH